MVKGRKNTSVIDHMGTGAGVNVPLGRGRGRQRHGVEVVDEGRRVPGRALHGRPLLLLLWRRWSSIPEPWRRSEGVRLLNVRLLHVLLLWLRNSSEGSRRRSKRRPRTAWRTRPELHGARPWVVERCRGAIAAPSVGDLLLLVAAAATAAMASAL